MDVAQDRIQWRVLVFAMLKFLDSDTREFSYWYDDLIFENLKSGKGVLCPVRSELRISVFPRIQMFMLSQRGTVMLICSAVQLAWGRSPSQTSIHCTLLTEASTWHPRDYSRCYNVNGADTP